jgi:hypothetical protein
MFIAWKGRGILVAAITIGSCLATQMATEAYYHNEMYFQQHGWPKFAALAVAAGIVQLLLPNDHGEHLTDPQLLVPSRNSLLRDSDQFFYIPVKHWPPILLVLGLLLCFVHD